ncbi:MAG: DUF4845 domain-containing protein [Betaproteobacteria bacterium]
MSQSRRLASQRGTSVLGLVVIAIVVGFFMLMGARIFPSVNEYLTIRKAVTRIMHSNPGGPADIRSSFEKTTEVEYSIKTIGPKDLVIVPQGDGLKTSFEYNIEIPIVEPVYILVKYSGSASSGGAKGP